MLLLVLVLLMLLWLLAWFLFHALVMTSVDPLMHRRSAVVAATACK